jgi:hypothetical protein
MYSSRLGLMTASSHKDFNLLELIRKVENFHSDVSECVSNWLIQLVNSGQLLYLRPNQVQSISNFSKIVSCKE